MPTKIENPEEPTKIGAFAAKTELSKLLRQARAGKRFIITQRGTPVAELRPIEVPTKQKSKWGDLEDKGDFWIADDFCEPIEEMREYVE
jgi:prevent-host-death family protein